MAYWGSPAVVNGKGAQLLNINSGRQKGGREEENAEKAGGYCKSEAVGESVWVKRRIWYIRGSGSHRERECVGEVSG